ncbi:unnamed protein product [Vitrella brassicaformis CCMP3155]|uniref:Fluoride ion transporter CrcB n=2 Tax=Vitrella brassicaformis TaxID=1169539 RepID=A0A0G4GA25_VITBC|nr:unnamed protein product [Vitrella brassicaformis CCMP3155]|mmetsp:Transcript_45541/g.128553  ORF Transcript_45541/g.128553 Transcript_45541/m.128553 type:complete len:454 (-) Transcript_45541:150-1511(-)|eukprot:CEM25707.1 unnamed protein product [Vitrella brassicaformis CCMP3155]
MNREQKDESIRSADDCGLSNRRDIEANNGVTNSNGTSHPPTVQRRAFSRPKHDGFSGHSFEHTCRETIHVSLFAILGVLARQGTSQLFGPPLWNVMPPPLFSELPANALGSFTMGMAASAVERIKRATGPSVHLGVSTGFCGSFTTFASWMYRVIKHLADGQVVTALLMVMLGFHVSIMSFFVGKHAHLLLERMLEPTVAAVAEEKEEDTKTVQTGMVDTLSGQHKEAVDSMRGLHREMRGAVLRRSWSAILQLDSALENLLFVEDNRPPISRPDNNGDTTADAPAKMPTAEQRFHNGCLLLSGTAVFLICYGALVCAAIFDRSSYRFDIYWLPALLGPAGAIVRWQLGKVNKLPRFAGKFPLGTFLANVVATFANGVLSAVLLLYGYSLDELSGEFTVASMSGIDASLSTVSTFVAELHGLELWRAYVYGLLSVVVAVGVGIVPYGAVYWTM